MKESNNPLVCVLMPVYNGESTIRLALDSLLIQSFENWICVVVNDGSTDNTPKIIKSYSEKDKRFIVVNLKKNMGRGYARQLALDSAIGDLLTFLDADDYYHPNKLENQIQIMKNYPEIYLVSCALGSFDNKYSLRAVRGFKFSGIHYFSFKNKPRFIPVTSMLRLKDAQKIKYNIKLDASEDTDYLTRYIDGRDYYILNSLLYYYREFDSVSYCKLIKYSFNNTKRAVFMFSESKFISVKSFIIELCKLIAYLFLYPVFGKQYITKRRGNVPTINQSEEFEEIKRKLSII